jgi:hypothetical protein
LLRGDNITREKHSKTHIINIKDKVSCEFTTSGELYSCTPTAASLPPDIFKQLGLFMLPEIPPQSEPLTCRIGTLEELVIEPNMGLSTSMSELDFLEDPEYCEFINSFPNDKRFLLLTDNDKLWIWNFLFFTRERISSVRKEDFERIIYINCFDMNNTELRNEIFSNDVNNNVFVLYDISKKNFSLFKKIKTILLGKKFPLIVASLRKDETKIFLNEELRTAFLVVNALKSDKEVAESEDGQDGEATIHKPRQEETQDNYAFHTDGERWYIKFEDEVLKPENLDGFRYIHHLMEYNNKITPIKLYQAVKGVKTSKKDEEDSVKTYIVNPRAIEKAQLGELKEIHSNPEKKQFINKQEKIDKAKIKKLAKDLKKSKELLLNQKSELEEEGRFSETEDIEQKIKDVQKRIDIVTRKDRDSEHKQFYDLVSKAIEKAKAKIEKQSIKNNYDSLLTWNHFKDSIVYNDFHYSYKPTTPISWKL